MQVEIELKAHKSREIPTVCTLVGKNYGTMHIPVTQNLVIKSKHLRN